VSEVAAYSIGRFDGTRDEWDDYVRAHSEARFCHSTAYQLAVREGYGLEPIRFALRRSGRMCGVFGVAAGRSMIFGRKWISMPYGEYGGFLIDPDVPDQEARRFAEVVIEEARRSSVGCVEVNGILGLASDPDSQTFRPAVGYEVAVLDLSPGPKALLEKTVTYEVRKAIRKAESRGLTAREASDRRTIREIFYPMHLDSMRRLGVPPHSQRYFLGLKAGFGEDMKIFWAERDGMVQAGLLGIRSGARVQIIATVSRPDGWEDRPNDLAHWAFISWACEQGVRWFDFGSVRYEGQRRFKKKWGVAFSPAAHWIAHLSGTRRVATFDSSSESLSLASRAWKAAVPLPATRWLGPLLRKQLLR
jgi:hypothetical protein